MKSSEKNNCRLFERFLKAKKNGISFLEYFFVIYISGAKF